MTPDPSRTAGREPGQGAAGAPAVRGSAEGTDPLAAFDPAARAAFTAVADQLIPAAHGMPSAGEVIGDARLRFVLTARPDLAEPLSAALRPGLGDDAAARLAALEPAEPDHYQALISTVVFAYYTAKEVRDLLGYPGQEAKTIYSWKVPDFVEEGLSDAVLARGPVWRDPTTGRRAEATDPG